MKKIDSEVLDNFLYSPFILTHWHIINLIDKMTKMPSFSVVMNVFKSMLAHNLAATGKAITIENLRYNRHRYHLRRAVT